MNHVMEANDLWMGVPYNLTIIFGVKLAVSNFTVCCHGVIRAVGGVREGGVNSPPPYFERSFPTRRGADYAKHINTRTLPHPHFSDLPTPLCVMLR